MVVTAFQWTICFLFVSILVVFTAIRAQEVIINPVNPLNPLNPLISQHAVSETVKQVGEQLGLALLDSLLQKGQEEAAKQALQRQIELLEDINPPYAKLLKQIPPETMVSAALAQRQQSYGPLQDTGNPLLNVLAKNGFVTQGTGAGSQNSTQQIGNVFQAVLRNILQSVQPSVVQNSLLGPQLPQQEITNPLAPNANQLVIPQLGGSGSGLLSAFAQGNHLAGGANPFGGGGGRGAQFPPSFALGGSPAAAGFNPGSAGLPLGLGLGGGLGAGLGTSLGSLGSPQAPAFKVAEPAEAPPNPFGASESRSQLSPDEFLFTTPHRDGSFVTEKEKQQTTTVAPEEITTVLVDYTDETDLDQDRKVHKESVEASFPNEIGTSITRTPIFPSHVAITTATAAPITVTSESLLTREQKRLQEINARMHRLLAYRKTQ